MFSSGTPSAAPRSSPYASSMGFSPSGRELNSASTQNVRSLTGSSATSENVLMSPSSATASLRTANR